MHLILLVPLVVLVALVATVVTAAAPRPDATDVDVETSPDAFRRARRHAALVAGASWAALLLTSWFLRVAVRYDADDDLATAYAPVVAGVTALLVAAIGERTWPRPAAPVRRAALVRRTVRDLAPPRLTRVTLAWTAALVLLLTLTAATADPGGRSITVDHDATTSSMGDPYPGAPFGLVVGAAVLVLLAATGAALHLVAARPAVAEVSTADDARLRRTSAARVLACTQLVVGGVLGSTLLSTGNALQRAGSTAWSGPDAAATTQPFALVTGQVAQGAGALVLVAALVLTVATLVRASRRGATFAATAVPE